MKVFSNLTELLSRMHTERKLLHELFQARQKYDFRYEEALEFVNSERKRSEGRKTSLEDYSCDEPNCNRQVNQTMKTHSLYDLDPS